MVSSAYAHAQRRFCTSRWSYALSWNPTVGDGDLPVIHPSEEILLLEQGQLDVLVESETIRLNAGDTTVVQSNLPHIVLNPGDTTAVGLAVFTPLPFGFQQPAQF